jgi:hypothetical protein
VRRDCLYDRTSDDITLDEVERIVMNTTRAPLFRRSRIALDN